MAPWMAPWRPRFQFLSSPSSFWLARYQPLLVGAIVLQHVSQVIHVEIDVGAEAMHGLDVDVTPEIPNHFQVRFSLKIS